MPSAEELLPDWERYFKYYADQRTECGVASPFEVYWMGHISGLHRLRGTQIDPKLTSWLHDPAIARFYSKELTYQRIVSEIETCRNCGLYSTRTKVVPGDGPLRAEVMVVGEAPGKEEDLSGKPFVGKAGQELFIEILDKMMEWKRDAIFVANTLKCVVGTTKISSIGTEIAYRRPYNGPVITIKSRDQLTCTPNHPILTTRGLLPAGKLVKGDELVRCTLREHVRCTDPHVCYVPATAQEMFDALALASVSQGVADADVNFHGDGSNSEVQVVRSNSELRNRIKAPTLQHLADLMLEGPDEASAFLECIGSTNLAELYGPRIPTLATDRRVRAAREPATLLRAGPEHTGDHGGASVADLNPSLREVLLEPTLADRELLRKALEPLASEVSFDKVIEIHGDTYSGHVYNLQTDCGWFTASGYIVSNCRPPNNRDPEPAEIMACQHFLHRQIMLVSPKVIVAAGKHAARWLTGLKVNSLSEVLGRILWYQHFPVVCIPHPSAYLRQKHVPKDQRQPMDYGKLIWQGLQEVKRIASLPFDDALWKT